LQDVKLRDVKLTDRVAGHEIAGVKMTDQITRHEIGGHIIAGRKNRNAVFRCYFFKHSTLSSTLRERLFIKKRQHNVSTPTVCRIKGMPLLR